MKGVAMDIRIKGAAFREDYDYITRTKGQEGLAALNKRLRDNGCKYDLMEIKDLMAYPLGLRVDFLKGAREEFGWSDRDIFTMARNAPRVNSAIKLFVKYFVSLDTAFNSTAKYWSHYFNAGRLAPTHFDAKKGAIQVTLHDLPADPILYTQLSGYFVGVMDLTGVKAARCVRIARRINDNEVTFHLAYDP